MAKENETPKKEEKKLTTTFHCNKCGQDVKAEEDATDIKCPHCKVRGYVSTKDNAKTMKRGRDQARKLAAIRKVALNPEKMPDDGEDGWVDDTPAEV